MSEVIYTESCHAGLLCRTLNIGDSFGSSLSVGVCRIKLNNQTKYVVLPVECLRTRVQFPPPPPISSPATYNAVPVTAFSLYLQVWRHPAKSRKKAAFHYQFIRRRNPAKSRVSPRKAASLPLLEVRKPRIKAAFPREFASQSDRHSEKNREKPHFTVKNSFPSRASAVG